jgi:hypothetical protein
MSGAVGTSGCGANSQFEVGAGLWPFAIATDIVIPANTLKNNEKRLLVTFQRLKGSIEQRNHFLDRARLARESIGAS